MLMHLRVLARPFMVKPTQPSILSVAIKRGYTRTSRLRERVWTSWIQEELQEDQEKYMRALGRDRGL